MKLNKVIPIKKAISFIKDEAIIMISGFGGIGSPNIMIDEIINKKIKNITLISNDTAWENKGIGKLISAGICKKIITSHIGANIKTIELFKNGEIDVELIPQGTLAERIRAAGYGLGGILVKTGIGTEVEKGKRKIYIDGNKFLLEKPLFADISLVYADKIDKFGNMIYKGVAKNFNHIMAAAAKLTIAEAGKIVDIGDLDPNIIATPGIFVKYIVDGEYKC